jgi:hypothetical protein
MRLGGRYFVMVAGYIDIVAADKGEYHPARSLRLERAPRVNHAGLCCARYNE